MNNSVGIITQARMTSTRLPGKILKLVDGKTLLAHHIDRLRWSELPIYIATTTNSTDDVVEDFAKANNVFCYRGEEDNVLSRYYECAQKYSLDIIVRVTSDCPLIDGSLIRKAVDEYLEIGDDCLYYSNSIERTFPRGFDFEIFSFRLLEDTYLNAKLSSDKEHVTPYINQNKSGLVKFKHFLNEKNRTDIRITVDTEDDFTLISRLFEQHSAGELGCDAIIEIFEKNPSLIAINAHIEQKKL